MCHSAKLNLARRLGACHRNKVCCFTQSAVFSHCCTGQMGGARMPGCAVKAWIGLHESRQIKKENNSVSFCMYVPQSTASIMQRVGSTQGVMRILHRSLSARWLRACSSMHTFAELGLSRRSTELLETHGIVQPSAVQKLVSPHGSVWLKKICHWFTCRQFPRSLDEKTR